ncbi:MAG: Crp/Fnr family transcriptional regulator [Massilia sp.]|jgi:CRP/FNR family cyclic AMP-dependent transcriptional regulator|nr:Crp/Fnr family transcriptional regulator [Gemmatimonadales bacterium]MDB5910579.1 Crp/Fnr family transcriptional regulator [Massilia sp.]
MGYFSNNCQAPSSFLYRERLDVDPPAAAPPVSYHWALGGQVRDRDSMRKTAPGRCTSLVWAQEVFGRIRTADDERLEDQGPSLAKWRQADEPNGCATVTSRQVEATPPTTSNACEGSHVLPGGRDRREMGPDALDRLHRGARVAERQGLGALLPQEVWRALLAGGTVRRFDGGGVLMLQGDPGTHVLVLTAGHVKVTRVEPNGESLLLAVRGPGEVIGEVAVLDGTGRSASVIALDSCITYVLSAARFHRVVDEFRMEGVLLRHVLSRYREGEQVRAELAELSAGDCLARILLRLGAAIGGTSPALDLSQEELAAAAGLSRSAVAAELAELRRRGLVATGRRRLIICDLARLKAGPDAATE